MKRALIVGVGLSVIAGIVWIFLPREPRYGGKSLSTWLALYDSPAIEEQLAAQEATRRMGQSAIPALLEMLQSSDSKIEDWFQRVVARQSLIDIQVVPASVKRNRAERALVTLGAAAHLAVPRLAAILRAGKHDVAAVLASIGAPSVQPLIETVATVSNRFVRASAIAALGWLGSNAQPAVPLLLQIAQNTNDLGCGSAIRALGDIGEPKEHILPLLTNMFWTDISSVDAGYALWRMKEGALLPLTTAVTNENRRIASAAAAALVLLQSEITGKLVITGADRPRLSSIYNLKVLRSSYGDYRARASPEVLPVLKYNAASDDEQLRTASAAALVTVSNWISAARKEIEVEGKPLRPRW